MNAARPPHHQPAAAPDWWATAMLMQDMSRTLPTDWDHGTEFWLDAVQSLAEAVVALQGRIPDERLATLLGAGGMMIAQAVRQSEATDMTAALFTRLRDGGAA